MTYHGNTHHTSGIEDSDNDEDTTMPQFQVYYDSDVGSGTEKVRAVNRFSAMEIMEDRGNNTVAHTAEKVAS